VSAEDAGLVVLLVYTILLICVAPRRPL